MVYNHIISNQSKAVNTPKLKTYTELNCTALKIKLDKQLVLYYELRALNTSGSGFIPFDIAIKQLQKIFHYSQATVYRIIEKGAGIFYEFRKSNQGRKTIKLYSLEKVTVSFGINHLSIPTLIDTKKCKNRQTIRAWLYATIFKTHEYDKPIHPISHKTIEEKTGLSTLSQNRYNRVVDIKIKPNYSNQTTIYKGKNREYITARQFGNSYETKLKKDNKGMVKKINDNLKKKFGKPSLGDEANETKNTLRFYDAVKNIKGIFGETYLLDKRKNLYNLWSKI